MPAPLLSVSQHWRHFTARCFGHVRVFPKKQTKVTSIYMMMGGLANFVIPLLPVICRTSACNISLFSILLSAAGPDYRNYCFYPLLPRFYFPENDVRFGERKFSTRLNTISIEVKGVNYGCYRKIRIDWVMAYPIRHSLSPEMQNKALEKRDCHLPIWPSKWITIAFPEN